jgi:uncharacterized protein (DUF342 family)
LKVFVAKNDEYSKTINSLRSKIATMEENFSDLKQSISEKEKENIKQKEKIISL